MNDKLNKINGLMYATREFIDGINYKGKDHVLFFDHAYGACGHVLALTGTETDAQKLKVIGKLLGEISTNLQTLGKNRYADAQTCAALSAAIEDAHTSLYMHEPEQKLTTQTTQKAALKKHLDSWVK